MRLCTGAVMKTVLPDRARPVTPSLTVGNTRSEAKSPRLRKASPRSWVYVESGTMASYRGGRDSGRVERGLQAQPCRDPPIEADFSRSSSDAKLLPKGSCDEQDLSALNPFVSRAFNCRTCRSPGVCRGAPRADRGHQRLSRDYAAAK